MINMIDMIVMALGRKTVHDSGCVGIIGVIISEENVMQ